MQLTELPCVVLSRLRICELILSVVLMTCCSVVCRLEVLAAL